MNSVILEILPWMFAAFAVVIAIPKLKHPDETYITSGICFGVAVGILLCNYVRTLPLSYGMSICLLMGVLMGANTKKRK